MLGSFSQLPSAITVILPAVVGSLVIYLFFVFQYFLPIKSSGIRIGLSLLFGGILGNVYDRINLGYVVDFIQIQTPLLTSAVFNVADICQWLGVSLFFLCFILKRKILYPPNERRDRKWIEPGYQTRYCLTLVLLGLAFSIISGTLAFSFLKISLVDLNYAERGRLDSVLGAYLQTHFAISIFFLLSLFMVGVYLSHRVVGPIKRFELFLEDLLNGKASGVRLRKNDEFQQFQSLALQYHTFFHERLGFPKPPLMVGSLAPACIIQDSTGQPFNFEMALGKQKVWLMFLRYSNCPLCALYLDGIRSLLSKAKASHTQVYAIYENSVATFSEEKTQSTSDLLKSVGIQILFDPEKKLYRHYRTNVNRGVAFMPRTFIALLKARWRGYRQGKIDGVLGQLPAHFFINADGTISWTYYGTDFSDHPPEDRVNAFISSP